MLKLADQEGRGALAYADKARGAWVGQKVTLADKGGGAVLSPPPFLADMICEQPLLR